MKTDQYMMAKAWMKQDRATQEEAAETWNTLEAEFNEERKQMLMAKEIDELKQEIIHLQKNLFKAQKENF